jgi:hypothetical protein
VLELGTLGLKSDHVGVVDSEVHMILEGSIGSLEVF